MIRSKKHLSALFLVLLPTTLLTEQTIFLPSEFTLEHAQQLVAQKIKTDSLELAFDIHKVILNPSSKKQIALLAKDPARFQLLSFLTSISLAKHAWTSIAHLTLRPLLSTLPELTIEKFIEPIEATHPQLVTLLIKLANALELDKNVAGVIEKLAHKQIPIRVASNINSRVFAELKEQLIEEKNNIFSLFTLSDNQVEGKVVSNGGICKPDARYFEEYGAEFNPHNNKLLVFIDDKKENVLAAHKHDSFIGIVFKNAKQLESDLITLGILN
jgi:FMN phosphatase YigB (HAD superfamily)